MQHAHGKARLEDLGVGEARVRHVRLHGRAAIEGWARTGAARDGFVVLHPRIAEGEVVHRALRGRKATERREQHIDDDL